MQIQTVLYIVVVIIIGIIVLNDGVNLRCADDEGKVTIDCFHPYSKRCKGFCLH